MLARVLLMALLDLTPEDARSRSLPFGSVLVVDPVAGGA